MIDETRLGPGTLSERGCKSLKALQGIVGGQCLFYDFTYQNIEFATNFRLVGCFFAL